MDYKNDKNFQRSMIIDNYENPNKKTDENFNDSNYKSFNFTSESCMDNLTLFLKWDDNIVEDVLFNGIGCAVSTSASNILANFLIGKSKEEVILILENYEKMIDGASYDDELLKELNVFSNIHNQPNRIKCAKIALESIRKIMNGDENGR